MKLISALPVVCAALAAAGPLFTSRPNPTLQTTTEQVKAKDLAARSVPLTKDTVNALNVTRKEPECNIFLAGDCLIRNRTARPNPRPNETPKKPECNGFLAADCLNRNLTSRTKPHTVVARAVKKAWNEMECPPQLSFWIQLIIPIVKCVNKKDKAANVKGKSANNATASAEPSTTSFVANTTSLAMVSYPTGLCSSNGTACSSVPVPTQLATAALPTYTPKE